MWPGTRQLCDVCIIPVGFVYLAWQWGRMFGGVEFLTASLMPSDHIVYIMDPQIKKHRRFSQNIPDTTGLCSVTSLLPYGLEKNTCGFGGDWNSISVLRMLSSGR